MTDPVWKAAEAIAKRAEFLAATPWRLQDPCEWASIIRTSLAKALPDLIEAPRRFNWARQNYCSGWNQCVHEMRRRLRAEIHEALGEGDEDG